MSGYEQQRDAAAEKAYLDHAYHTESYDAFKRRFELGSDWSRDYWTRWRPVSEVPEHGQMILEVAEDYSLKGYHIIWWRSFFGSFASDTVYWMPLQNIPPLPQTGGGK